jgi:hypothetical protein
LLKSCLLFFAIGYALSGVPAGAQETANWGNTICPPSPNDETASPDNHWTVLSTEPDARIWMLDNSTGRRRFLLDCQASISVGWAPDSKSFFINDHEVSNADDAFLYDTSTLKVINIGKLLTASDAQYVRYLTAGHHYVDVQRWISPHEAMVVVSGHFDSPPAESFEFHYSVGLDGKVTKMK